MMDTNHGWEIPMRAFIKKYQIMEEALEDVMQHCNSGIYAVRARRALQYDPLAATQQINERKN
jgi:hypothetical protein